MSDTLSPHLLDQEHEILVAMRRIIHATDLGAKELGHATGLTTSQLLVLQLLESDGSLGAGQIAKELRLAKPTVTTILDHLEDRAMVTRRRGKSDRRQVVVSLTRSGRRSLSHAPTPLQTRFIEQFKTLSDWERTYLLAALQRVCHLLGAAKIDASPVLDVGAIARATKPPL